MIFIESALDDISKDLKWHIYTQRTIIVIIMFSKKNKVMQLKKISTHQF